MDKIYSVSFILRCKPLQLHSVYSGGSRLLPALLHFPAEFLFLRLPLFRSAAPLILRSLGFGNKRRCLLNFYYCGANIYFATAWCEVTNGRRALTPEAALTKLFQDLGTIEAFGVDVIN